MSEEFVPVENLVQRTYNALDQVTKDWLAKQKAVEALNSSELYDMLVRARNQLNIPPWHPITGYFKAVLEMQPDARKVSWLWGRGRENTSEDQLRRMSAERTNAIPVFREYTAGSPDRCKMFYYDVELGALWSTKSEQYITYPVGRPKLLEEIQDALKKHPDLTEYVYYSKRPSCRIPRSISEAVYGTETKEEREAAKKAEEPKKRVHLRQPSAFIPQPLTDDMSMGLRTIIRMAEDWDSQHPTHPMKEALEHWKHKLYTLFDL